MADIELVIKVPEKLVCEGFDRPFSEDEKSTIIKAVGNGTPLPKGHGRIGDLDRLYQVFERNVVGGVFRQLFDMAPTIIEADTESEET